MIDWLVQSTQDHPALTHGQPPDGLLAERELEQFAALKTAKRRRDWLLGRWTAKRLVWSLVQRETGDSLRLEDILIAKDPDGAPCVNINFGFEPPQVTLSISHSGDRAFCASISAAIGGRPSTGRPPALLGADIERVEARPAGFAGDYFTVREAALVARTPSPSRDLLATAIWSAKEAALKALHLGLTVDTRSVTCLIEPAIDPWLSWTPFPIEWDVGRLNNPVSHQQEPPHLAGWWRVQEGYVLTLAAEPGIQPQPPAAQTETNFAAHGSRSYA